MYDYKEKKLQYIPKGKKMQSEGAEKASEPHRQRYWNYQMKNLKEL